MRRLMCLMLAVIAVQAETVWNAENGFGKFGPLQRLKGEIVEGILTLTEIGKDSGITVLDLDVDPNKLNSFVYKYRAVGTGEASGQLFYAREGERFSDLHRWRLPSLVADGEWHTNTLGLAFVKDKNDWLNGGMITSMRLDLTDSAGGKIEIAEFKFIHQEEAPKKTKAKPAPKAKPVLTTEKAVWNLENQFAGITDVRNARVEKTSKGLLVHMDKSDSQICIGPVELEPFRCNTLVYTYRSDIASAGTGQLYFGSDRVGINANRFWELPTLAGNGEWQTVTLDYTALRDRNEWFQDETITTLRLDPTDSAGGTFELAELRFEYRKENDKPILRMPPLPKLEPTMDTEPWPPITPKFTPLLAPPPLQSKKYFSCKMISSPEDKKGLGAYLSFYVRKEFELPSKPVMAWLQFTADDSATAYVNGSKVAFFDNWRVACCKNVTNLLNAGKNVLGFNYSNGDTWGGVFAELYVRLQDGKCININTDDSFRSAVVVPENWCKAEYDASDWESVRVHPGPPNPPWSSELAYVDFNTPTWKVGSKLEPTIVTAGEKVHFTTDFKGAMPQLPFEGKIVLRLDNIIVWSEKRIFTEQDVTKTGDQTWNLAFDFETPLYFTTMDVKFSLEGASLYCIGTGYPSASLSIRGRKSVPGYENPPHFKVKEIAGSPAFTLNGKPFYPMWGALQMRHRYDCQPIHNDKHTPNLVSVYTLDAVWQKLDRVVLQLYDQSAELYRRNNPGAYFMVNISFYPPKREFIETYPDDMCLDDEGKINQDGRICYSFASKRVLKMFEEHLDQVLTYLESSPYANRIVGYRLVGGHTIEWLGWDPRPGHTLDFSPVCKQAFKEYLQKKHPEITDYSIPTMAERRALDDDEILWDPKKHAKVIAFNSFYSENITNIVIDLCRRARKIVGPDKVLGTYQGYTMTLAASGVSHLRAHYDFKRFLDSGCIDYVMSPQPYSVRNIGDPMGDMKPFASIAAHNVIPVIEDDTRTFNARAGLGYYQMPNFETSLSAIQRNFATVLCRNTPTYYYSLSAGTEFTFPEAGEVMADIQRIGQHCLEQGVRRNAEIAVVVSEATIKAMPVLAGKAAASGEMSQYYRDDGTVGQRRVGGCVYTNESLQTNYIKYACMGAPVDYLLAEDLADHPGNYKLYFFVNCIAYDRDFLKAVEALRKRDCTLFWIYAPGYTFGDTNSVENMKRLTGIAFAKCDTPIMPAVYLADNKVLGNQTTRLAPMFHALEGEALGKYENGKVGLAKLQTGKATSYFCGAYQFNAPFLVELAKNAGVHVYTESLDPVEANEALFTLHARHAGKKTVHLPRKCDVLDVYNNRLVATDTDTFTFEAPLHSTYLFYYGKDARKLLK